MDPKGAVGANRAPRLALVAEIFKLYKFITTRLKLVLHFLSCLQILCFTCILAPQGQNPESILVSSVCWNVTRILNPPTYNYSWSLMKHILVIISYMNNLFRKMTFDRMIEQNPWTECRRSEIFRNFKVAKLRVVRSSVCMVLLPNHLFDIESRLYAHWKEILHWTT